MKNKFGKALENIDLAVLGCTEEAIKQKYIGSDSGFYLNEETGEITEAIRGVELVTTFKDADEFVRCFNNIEDCDDEF